MPTRSIPKQFHVNTKSSESGCKTGGDERLELPTSSVLKIVP